jgi:amidase
MAAMGFGLPARLGSSQLHPLLQGWLEPGTLPHRGRRIRGYWAELDRYRAEMFAFLRRFDAILCPVYPQPALPHGTSTETENFLGFSHTMAYNVAGWPAAVVRCGESAGGLPVAVQIVAAPWREDITLALAGWMEQAFGGWKPPAL